MKNIALILLVILLAGCSTTYSKENMKTIAPDGMIKTTQLKDGTVIVHQFKGEVELVEKRKAYHKNRFSDKKVKSLKANIGSISFDIKGYDSKLNPEAIKESGDAAGNIAGEITEGAVRGASTI